MGQCMGRPSSVADEAATPTATTAAAAVSVHRARSEASGSLAAAPPPPRYRLHGPWKSDGEEMTREQLERKRAEFWDTRVTNRPEIWAVLRSAIEEPELDTAQQMLEAAAIILRSGDLVDGAYDELGNRYDIPEYCLSDPVHLREPDPQEAEDGYEKSETLLVDSPDHRDSVETAVAEEVRVRMSDTGHDFVIGIAESEHVGSIREKVAHLAGIKDKRHIKLACLGKILDDKKSLASQWQHGHVVQALVTGQ